MAITIQLAVTFAALLVENEHLVTLNEGIDYFAYYLSAFNYGSAYSNLTIVVYQQHLFKFNSLTAFCVLNVVYEELLAFFHLELLTVNLYDCVHFYFYLLNGFGP